MRDRLALGRVVLADLPAPALDAEALGRNARLVRGAVDAVLLGDSPRERVQLSPALRAQLVQQQGVAAWSGMTARDRNRVALEGEFASLAVVGAAAVHCVTGDHPASGTRPDALGVFDLDATRMAALAASAGLLVSVAAAPAAPPTATRAARLLAKLDAGAEVCIVDHCGGTDAVARFVQEVHDLGRAPAFLACVPVVLDVGSARLLQSFPGLTLPDGFLDAVLAASDPFAAGIEAAVRLAEAMLELDGVVGVDLSGGPAPGQDERFSEGLARIATRLKG